MAISSQNEQGCLFWYPALNSKYDFDKPLPKGDMLNSYILYYLARLQSMFRYDGLPDSIPQKWLEHYLMVNGSCAFIMDGDDLIVTIGGQGGIPDRYYIPTNYIVANPYISADARRTYTIGEDCVLIRNDTYCQGLLPLLNRYCSQMVENEVTMNIADILTRAMLTITATDENSRESVELWLKKLRHGELAAIGELPSMVGNQDRSVNIQPFQSVAGTITDIIEYHQYLKAGLYNELGLNSNYNMKRESINSNESQLNDDMLHPLIDEMLRCRREALEQVNDMFGTNITVDFDSSWKDNQVELELVQDQMQIQSDMIHESEDTEDISTQEEATEDTDSVNDTEDITEEVSHVEELVSAIEDLTAAIEGDDSSDDKEGEE